MCAPNSCVHSCGSDGADWLACVVADMEDILAEFDERKFHWTYWIWRRTKSWGEGGYPIERQAEDGSYSIFELALKQLATYIGHQ
jgi:hypothetical protein